MIENTIKLTHNKQQLNRYGFEYDSIYNPLLVTIAYYITTYIGYSDRYKECLNNQPFVYHINASTMERADNYILFGLDSGLFAGYMPSDKFTNLMMQWKQAYNAQPEEILITIDEEKKFTISYQSSTTDFIQKNNVLYKQNYIGASQKEEDPKPWFISMHAQYVEFQLENAVYYAVSNNKKLLMFGELLIQLPTTLFFEKIKTKPFEFNNFKYCLTVIEDRVLIYDKIMEVRAFPPLESFSDLVGQWQSAINQKPELIRLYIEDDYNFKIRILKPFA